MDNDHHLYVEEHKRMSAKLIIKLVLVAFLMLSGAALSLMVAVTKSAFVSRAMYAKCARNHQVGAPQDKNSRGENLTHHHYVKEREAPSEKGKNDEAHLGSRGFWIPAEGSSNSTNGTKLVTAKLEEKKRVRRYILDENNRKISEKKMVPKRYWYKYPVRRYIRRHPAKIFKRNNLILVYIAGNDKNLRAKTDYFKNKQNMKKLYSRKAVLRNKNSKNHNHLKKFVKKHAEASKHLNKKGFLNSKIQKNITNTKKNITTNLRNNNTNHGTFRKLLSYGQDFWNSRDWFFILH